MLGTNETRIRSRLVTLPTDKGRCRYGDAVSAYALDALPPAERADLTAHIASCPSCQQELAALRPIVASFSGWPTGVIRPSTALWGRLVDRIAAETDGRPLQSPPPQSQEPEWELVAPGIACKLLSNDLQRDRVSMLVQLAPGTAYPPHSHAGVEELHLLDGELWIDDRKLHPGDYNRAEPGTSDRRVWSETGCTCLLITSPGDILG
jgi:anti-sigma factor ChrR (cupin superfamily)